MLSYTCVYVDGAMGKWKEESKGSKARRKNNSIFEMSPGAALVLNENGNYAWQELS